MKIGMVLLGTGFPPDIRVEKECRELVRAGHRIVLLTERKKGEQEVDDTFMLDMRIIRSEIPAESPLFQLLSLSFFTLIRWKHIDAIRNFIISERPDALHVHDLSFLPTVLRVLTKEGLHIPVIADLHENMPAAKVAYRSDTPPLEWLARFIIFNYRIWRWHERRALSRCDKVVVVVPEAMPRIRSYGIPDDRIVVVSNTESESTFPVYQDRIDREVITKYEGTFTVSYIGGIGAHRGLKTVIRAAGLLASSIPEFKLLIIGAKPEDKNLIHRYMTRYKVTGLSDRIEIIQWIPFGKVVSYIAVSSVCLVPHENLEHTNTTIPHKLFQYMLAGRPVLVSDCAPLKRVVGDNGIGFVFKAGDPVDFAEKVRYIRDNPGEAANKVRKAKTMALGDFSWVQDAKRLTDLYRNLERNIPGLSSPDLS